MTTRLRRHRRRCTTTLLASVTALARLWTVELPAPDWAAALGRNSVAGPDLLGLATHAARGIAVALLGYLVVAAASNLAASFAARTGRLHRAVAATARLAPRWLTTASVTLVAGASLWSPTAGAAGDDGRRSDVVMELVEEPAARSAIGARTMLPWAFPAGSASSTTLPPADSEPPRLSPIEPPGVGADQLPPPLVIERDRPDAMAEHTVRPGDHFWSIAELVVAERGLDVPVGRYWRLLVEANRSRLVDPANPDLLYPGQVLVLP